MMSAGNPDDFLDLVDQAIFDADDLIACAQDESDSDSEKGVLIALRAGLSVDAEAINMPPCLEIP